MVALLLLSNPAMTDVGTGDTAIECFCTDTYGQRVELGKSICLFVDGRAFVAKCEMSLNNPIWRDTGVNCTMSRLPSAADEVNLG